MSQENVEIVRRAVEAFAREGISGSFNAIVLGEPLRDG